MPDLELLPLLDARELEPQGLVTLGESGLASAVNAIIFRLPNGASTTAGGILRAAGLYDCRSSSPPGRTRSPWSPSLRCSGT